VQTDEISKLRSLGLVTSSWPEKAVDFSGRGLKL